MDWRVENGEEREFRRISPDPLPLPLNNQDSLFVTLRFPRLSSCTQGRAPCFPILSPWLS